MELKRKVLNFVTLENGGKPIGKKTYFECVSASGEADEISSGSRLRRFPD